MLWWRRPSDERLFGGARSGAWPRVRKAFLASHPACKACGRSRSLEVHHIKPFHEHPELELEESNLITLCGEPCHIVFGHMLNWKQANPHVAEDAAAYMARMRDLGVRAKG